MSTLNVINKLDHVSIKTHLGQHFTQYKSMGNFSSLKEANKMTRLKREFFPDFMPEHGRYMYLHI